MQPSPVVVDPVLQKELKPQEYLLWWGHPDPKHRANRAREKNIRSIVYITCALATFVLLSLAIFCLLLVPLASSVASFIAPFLVVLFLCLCFLSIYYAYRLYNLYRSARKNVETVRNTVYGITNRRIIVITTGKNYGVKSHTKEDIGQITRIETGDGWGDLSYGTARQVQVGQRILVVADKLAGIPDVRQVEDILMKTFKSAQ